MKREKQKTVDDFDPFTRPRILGISERWQACHKRWQEASDALWIGIYTSEFEDDELAIISELGVMCEYDVMRLKRAGRPRPEPIVVDVEVGAA